MSLPNFNLVDIVDGGAAEEGKETFFTLRLDGGDGHQDINVFLPYEKYGAMMALLSKFFAITTDTRKKINPTENTHGAMDVAFAPPVSGFSLGPSSDGESHILRANLANNTHYDMALDRKGLEALRDQIDSALSKEPEDISKKIN